MISDKLLNWYAENGRKLPWRGIDDPYKIWLSEIILQQTRIEQGMSYYQHFVTNYPTVLHLAAASEDQVLKSWQGLGYYSRARNMHAAARYVVEKLDGHFPTTHEGILALKGVGRYTAAAIASFAYRLPYPVIDGNVYRFVARLYGIFTPIGTSQAYSEFEQLLKRLIDKERPDLFNQAIMDFGSTFCKPIGCDCERCIFAQECVAHARGQVSLLPVKPQKVEVKERHLYYVDVRFGDKMVVQRRSAGDIWQGLYELPLLETEQPLQSKELEDRLMVWLEQEFGAQPSVMLAGPEMKHQLTHRTIYGHFFMAKYNQKPGKIPQKSRVIDVADMKTLPISRLIDRYLSKL